MGVVAVLRRNDLVLRGDEGGVTQAHEVISLALDLLHVLLIFFGQCFTDFIAAGNGGAHFHHASVGLRVGACLRLCLQCFKGGVLRNLEQFGYCSFFFMVSPHAKDLHEHGQSQAGQHKGEEEYGEHHDDSILADLFSAVDHGDGQSKN